MTPEDMATCHARAVGDAGRPWSVEEFASLTSSPLVFDIGDARGFALGRVVADEAELLMLATDPAHRRGGLARAALADFEAEARARDATIAFLEVAADNDPALWLYRAAGYVELARRKGYYARVAGRTVDAIVMRKPLADRSSPGQHSEITKLRSS